jgi:hypothetical protein
MVRWLCIFALMFGIGCREVYNVIPKGNGTGYLVVEGIVNSQGKSVIHLSRTTSLAQNSIIPERKALVSIEGETNGLLYTLREIDLGVYESDDLSFDDISNYRLRITTADGKQFASGYKKFVNSPAIDSLSWQREADGVRIFIHAHDDANSTLYYKWDYDEVWEFKSSFHSNLEFIETPDDPDGFRYRLDYSDPDSMKLNDSIYTCWQNRSSSNINIASTTRLSADVLYQPVLLMPNASWDMSYLYSINVKMYGLSKDGYEFFSRMKKNTESLGSIFDAQPSEISGNIRHLGDSSDLVIGYVEFTNVHEKRLFISNESLPGWNYNDGCIVWFEPDRSFSIYPYPNDRSLFERIIGKALMPTIPAETFNRAILTFRAEHIGCVDCTIRGYHKRPDFWP